MNELELQAKKKTLVWENNPVLLQLLGLSPVLAVSSTLVDGLGLGIATFIVCVLSCLSVSLLRGVIPHQWRLVCYLLLLASYTTMAEIIVQVYFYPLFARLGIYLPLICCNIAILIRMETVASQSDWPAATLDAVKNGCGFLMALGLFAACRELLISGTFFADSALLLPVNSAVSTVPDTLNAPLLFQFANTQAAALLLLGLFVALFNYLSQLRGKSSANKPDEIIPVKRARVTGRLSKE